METWFSNTACIRIPVDEFDPDTVSYTYGDSLAAYNPALDTGEEWWGRVYRYDGIAKLIAEYGFPEDPEYDMRRRIFPKDKPINKYLKYVEAHVWSGETLDRYL